MSQYKIVCTDQVPITQPTNHAHIVNVGVDLDEDGYADTKHAKELVIANLRAGHSYYTVGNYSGEKAWVVAVSCDKCSGTIIKTAPDDTRDNNLDSLRRCKWSR